MALPNTNPTPSNVTRVFSDFDINFVPHPVTKDLLKKTGTNSVVQSLMNLVQINSFEKPFHPEIASNIRKMLFELVDPITANALAVEVRALIGNFEPRVNVKNVFVTADVDNNGYNIIIEFFLVNVNNLITISVFLERVR
jgi:phage baseplate assembly protein W